jgi:hypothetical protein
MNNYRNTRFFAIALAATVCTGPVQAGQLACARGLENVAGTCVTAGLAASTQLRGTLMSQLKIGYNLPIPPRKDTLYPRNFDVSRFEFSQSGNFSVETFPPSP